MVGQAGLFDLQDRYAELSKSGDPLERLFVGGGLRSVPPDA